jgi:hypothetical protein
MRGTDRNDSLAGFAMAPRQIGKTGGVDYRASFPKFAISIIYTIDNDHDKDIID